MAARSGIETTRFLGVSEAAELLCVSPRTVYGWVQQRRIPFRKAGRRVLFDEAEILEWTKPDLDRHQHLKLIK
jgi:excisionase family DNA binding protein